MSGFLSAMISRSPTQRKMMSAKASRVRKPLARFLTKRMMRLRPSATALVRPPTTGWQRANDHASTATLRTPTARLMRLHGDDEVASPMSPEPETHGLSSAHTSSLKNPD